MSTELTYNQYLEAGYAKDFLNWFIENGCNLPAFTIKEEEEE